MKTKPAVPVPIVHPFGAVLRAARGDHTRRALAAQSGVSQESIYAIDRGRVESPTLHTAVALAHGLALLTGRPWGEILHDFAAVYPENPA